MDDKVKNNWLNQYKQLHETQENWKIEDLKDHNLNDGFKSILPIAMKVVVSTIGKDLVTVQPLGGGNSYDENQKINAEIKSENRDRKLNSILENATYDEMKREEHTDYKKSSYNPLPLLYMDMVYKK